MKTARLKATILGCGSSGGVPRLGGADGRGDWGVCDPEEPKNRRSRCSLLVQRESDDHGFDPQRTTNVLIDTAPDMRAQLLAAGVPRVDAVLFTHDHADQTHGIDDLRVLAIANRARVPVYVDAHTAGELPRRFRYCFAQKPGSLYPPILDQRAMPAMGETFAIEGPSGPVRATAFLQDHGGVDSLGFRFGGLAYSSDVVGLPEESWAQLRGLECWVLDALQPTPHKTHAHLDLALEWVARAAPQRAVLTNLHVSMDYETVRSQTPDHVAPAFDGMEIIVSAD